MKPYRRGRRARLRREIPSAKYQIPRVAAGRNLRNALECGSPNCRLCFTAKVSTCPCLGGEPVSLVSFVSVVSSAGPVRSPNGAVQNSPGWSEAEPRVAGQREKKSPERALRSPAARNPKRQISNPKGRRRKESAECSGVRQP